jgi:hypothetical protein
MTLEKRRLVVEGWRFIPHSYAVLNAFHCLELSDVALFHRDLPYFRAHMRERALLNRLYSMDAGSRLNRRSVMEGIGLPIA